MDRIQGFSQQEGYRPARAVEDAPQNMRSQLVDAFYFAAESDPFERFDVSNELYLIIVQSLGAESIAGNPMGGRRQRIGRDIANADWRAVYDLIVRLWPEYERRGLHSQYRDGVNRVLAGAGVVWELGDDGRLHRVVSPAISAQVEAAFAELRDPIYANALRLLKAAQDAYDDHPRRERDACSNAFDALEATAAAKLQATTAQFDALVSAAKSRNMISDPVASVLDKLNVLRHRSFGHGTPFALKSPEVDFAYFSCLAGILLLARL